MNWEQATPSESPEQKNSLKVVRAVHGQIAGKILLGRYRLNTMICKGGMGAVYLARDITDGSRFAVKILRNDLTLVPRVRERFLLEYRASHAIDHPAVVKTMDVGETAAGELFLVMEYVNGPPLRRMLRSGPIELQEALMLTSAIAEGLGAAHECGVIHRDLKPENILIPRQRITDSIVKIVDFGIARILDTPKITTTKHVLGTPAYISPEHAMGTKIDARTDIYSLGVIMYEMLSGSLPFTGQTPEELLERHIQSVPVRLGAHKNCRGISDVLEQLVMACLEKYPNNRPADMRTVLGTIEQI